MRRQELPEEAFISVEELERMFGDGNYDAWRAADHRHLLLLAYPTAPRPEGGVQLQTIAAVLEKEMPKYDKFRGKFKGFQDMGVFWDVRFAVARTLTIRCHLKETEHIGRCSLQPFNATLPPSCAPCVRSGVASTKNIRRCGHRAAAAPPLSSPMSVTRRR